MSANDTAIKEKMKYGDRIEFYTTCNPNYKKDTYEIIEYHERMKSLLQSESLSQSNPQSQPQQSRSCFQCGFIGIKLYYCYNGYDLERPAYEEWYEYANKHDLLALIHVDQSCEAAVKSNRLAKNTKTLPLY